MSHICAVCQERTRPDTDGVGVSHGICRRDALLELYKYGLITAEESCELDELLVKQVVR